MPPVVVTAIVLPPSLPLDSVPSVVVELVDIPLVLVLVLGLVVVGGLLVDPVSSLSEGEPSSPQPNASEQARRASRDGTAARSMRHSRPARLPTPRRSAAGDPRSHRPPDLVQVGAVVKPQL
jgi:hypothetical protein